MLTRRKLLKRAMLCTGLAAGPWGQSLFAAGRKRRLRIGACDWSLGKNSDPGAFQVAKDIGLEGIQVNLGNVRNNMHLRERAVQDTYLAEAKRTGIRIAGLAIGELNNIPYKSDQQTDEWVWDSVDVARRLGTRVILLAFFAKNDLRGDQAGKREVIRKLREVAPRAEKMNVILGIESYLSAAEHVEIMDSVGSSHVKVYYDFRNSADAGYDVIQEITWLGKERICELHMKENGFLLGQGSLDWLRIGETLQEMNYQGSGWMQIEGALPPDAGVVESYRHNLSFLKKIFHS